MHKNKIVQILLKNRVISAADIEKIEKEMQRTNLAFIQVLENQQIIGAKKLGELISRDIGVPFVDLDNYVIDDKIIKLVPEKVARKYKLIPLFQDEETITLAMFNPKDIIAMDEVRRITGIDNIDVVFALDSAINQAINNYYRGKGQEHIAQALETTEGKGEGESEYKQKKEAEKVSIVNLVNVTLNEAVKSRASDVHIEPAKEKVRLRYRIDGILYEINLFPKELQNAIISRIKIMANLDIAETRLPQDGKIATNILDKDLDIRVSTFPTVHGENIVMRLLDKSGAILELTELGLAGRDFTTFKELIQSPYGILIIAGPTGSGKTTTLYAVLNKINSLEKNIITIEDPVEYELPLIRQTQINVKAGLTFARGLRSILRQDPDVIMVGEIRDKETAEIAVQAALTGHLVLTTLHTNDAPSAINRLINMGVEPFLIASSVIGFMAQRLVRVICPKCKEKYIPSTGERDMLKLPESEKLFRSQGCVRCNNTGFLGRTGIFELIASNRELKELISNRASAAQIRQYAMQRGMKTIYENGLQKIKQGITTVEEVLRVTREV